MSADRSHRSSGHSPFPVTRWTLIRRAQTGSVGDAEKAMDEICRQYWYPIYAYARRFGLSVEDAEDLSQTLFQNIIANDVIQSARPEHGRMRTFMLAMLRNLANKKLRHDSAEKRGGERITLSFDELTREERYQKEPATNPNPELLFDRAWAAGVMETAEKKLREDFAQSGNLDRFEQLRECLPLGENATPYPKLAKEIGVSEGALRLQIHRMRKRYGILIEETIAQTVSTPEEAKAELEHLMTVISSGG